MKCKILHDLPGRLRVHLYCGRMTLSQADVLEYYLRARDGVQEVRVYDRTQDAVVVYGGKREDIISALAQFSFAKADAMELVPEHTSRALNREFEDKLAVTDSETSVRFDPEHKPGVSNLIQIYAAATGKTYEEIEAEFAGQGYGAFKTAVGDSVVELCRPIREEASRLIKDKAYLESVYRAGAEKAGYIASKTLRKVYKKVGFVPR